MCSPSGKPKGFMMSFIIAAVHGGIEKECASCNPHQEIQDYINSPLEIGECDPVEWWGVCTPALPVSINYQYLVFIYSTTRLSF